MNPVRDTTKTYDVYTAHLEDKLGWAKKFEEANVLPGRGELDYSIQYKYHEVADIMYSRGDAMKDIVPVFTRVLELQKPMMAWHRKSNTSPIESFSKPPKDKEYVMFSKAYKGLFESYYDVLLLVSKSILLNVDGELFRQFLKDTIKPGTDLLIDKLVNYKLPDWPVSGPVNYANKLEPLYAAVTETDADKRAELITAYIKSFMTKMKGHPLFGKHMLEDYNYMGYWCYAAPAVALVTNTPTDSFKNMRYYPADYFIKS